MSNETAFDGEAILNALITAGVEFIAIGGVAVFAHGYVRTTDDIDIVPEPSVDNYQRLASVLRDLDYEIKGAEDLEAEELIHPDVDNLAAGGSWVLTTKYGGLDILQLVEPDLDYETLSTDEISADAFGHRIRVAGYSHVVQMKEAAGRPQDIADLERLREVRDEVRPD